MFSGSVDILAAGRRRLDVAAIDCRRPEIY
jgi:hypothetical protein